MKTPINTRIVGQSPEFVAAPAIARRLSVTGRYILQMAEQGRIPCVRLGRKCVRFNPDAVAKALGIEWKDTVAPAPQPAPALSVPDIGISMEAEIDDLDINVDPHEPNAPSRRRDVEIEKALKKIDGINQERPDQ